MATENPERDRRSIIFIDLGQGDDAYDLKMALDEYLRLCGWSAKHAFLIGMASVIGKHGDNPDLVVKIADFIARGRKPRKDKKRED